MPPNCSNARRPISRSGRAVAPVSSACRRRRSSFGDISLRAHYRTGGPIIGSGALVYDGEMFDYKEAVIRNFPFARIGTYVFGAHIVEVEVDTVTGKVEILRAWAAHDVGRAINPTAVEGQIQGGFVQGAGYALLEELLWEDGQPINPSMMDYKVFGALDLPLEIHPIIVEAPEPSGPFGAKGIGEPPLVGAAPAIANAVADATGLRLRTLPDDAGTGAGRARLGGGKIALLRRCPCSAARRGLRRRPSRRRTAG